MKQKEQELAKSLRSKGKSVNAIAKELKVSSSSVSQWVRNVPLSEEQKFVLTSNISGGHAAGNKALIEKRRLAREASRNEGAAEARIFSLHLAGCMLYWAEGGKNRNSVQFTNSDPEMMNLFIRFLKECFGIKNEEATIYIKCYTNNGITVKQIEDYWLNILGLPRECLRKTTENMLPVSSRKRRKKVWLYGECRITVNRTDLIQRIYGSIQKYGNFSKKEWQE